MKRMNHGRMDAEHFEELVHRYLDGVSSAEDVAVLNEMLKTRPDTADLFVGISGMEGLLKDIHEDQQGIVGSRLLRPERRRDRRETVHPCPSRTWVTWAAVAACLAIIAGALVHNGRQEERFVEVVVAQIKKTSPDVKLFRAADGKTVVAVVGMDVFAGDRIEAKKGEAVVIGYPNEKTMVTAGSANRETELRIGDTKKGKRVYLERGVVEASVAPQPPDRHMVITTPHARAEVKGTRFKLDATRERTRLDVDEGLVVFFRRSDEAVVRVETGHYAIAAEGVTLQALLIEGAPQAPGAPLQARPFADIHYRDGRTLYEDDFSSGGANWMLFRRAERLDRHFVGGGAEGDGDVTEIVRDGIRTNALLLNTKGGPADTWLCARLKKKILARRFAVECEASVPEFHRGVTTVDFGMLAGEFIDGKTQQFFSAASRPHLPLKRWTRWRKEFVVVPADDGSYDIHMRFFVDGKLDVWGKESSAEEKALRIELVVRNAKALVARVAVKELVPVEEGQQ